MEWVPAHSDIGAAFATAVGTPGRLRLITALVEGPRTGAELADMLGTDVQSIARRALPLERLGLVARSPGTARNRVYRLVREPVFRDDVWEQLPTTTRRAVIASGLTQLHAMATAAIDGGGFDRRDMHITRSTFELSERAWREASRLLIETYERLRQLAAEDADEPELRATAVIMLFESPQEAGGEAPAPEPVDFSQSEAVQAGTELVERLEEMITGSRTPWASIAALADELRVVARAGMIEEARSPSAPAVAQP